MRQLSTFLIFALVIIVNRGSGVTAQDETKVDQVAEEAKNSAVAIIDSPKYVTSPAPPPIKPDLQTHKPEQRPPSKPPLYPEKAKHIFVDLPRYMGQFPKYPPPRPYTPMSMKLHPSNSIYQFPRVVPMQPHHKNFYVKSRPLQFASTYQTAYQVSTKPPKFSLPVQTINGIRADTVRPPPPQVPQSVSPKIQNTTTTTTTTTTETTTTAKLLRTKRIWPKRMEKSNTTSTNTTEPWDSNKDTSSVNEVDNETSASHRVRTFASRNSTTPKTPAKRGYRPVTRAPKVKSTTATSLPINFTDIGPNDWVPIVPSHYPKKIKRVKRTVTSPSKRSDDFPDHPDLATDKEMIYMQSFGIIPVPTTATMDRKNAVYFKKKRQSNPYHYAYHTSHVRSPYEDHHAEASHTKPRYVTKIKHHHHHHHHKYIKTVEKPVKVPYKVEVPKPYPVTVEKKVAVPVEKIKVVDRPVPYPITVEKKVPYPVGIKVPHAVPVKVVEKEYVPKPYPIVHHVPVVKHVQVKIPQPVPYPVEKKVPYPVEVKVPVPVDRPVPVAVTVEKQVPYPVKVLVPQPYPVETKVPYPVTVKEPVEVIKYVQVKVPVPQPYPVKVAVEKRVPYPVEVEKKVPVPVEVLVPQRVEIEKRVPVYIPRPYPVEKRVPYPVKVPYAVRVPYEVPVYIHQPYQMFEYEEIPASESPVTSMAQHTVTVHGNTGFNSGFQSRSDDEASTTTAKSS